MGVDSPYLVDRLVRKDMDVN